MRYEVRWGGLTVPLLCGLSALEYAEEQIGSIQQIFDNIAEKKDLEKTIDALFVGMARCACEADHEKPDEITIEACRKWIDGRQAAADLLGYIDNRNAVIGAFRDGFKVFYHGKQKKDKYTLAVEERMRKRQGVKEQKLTARSLYSRALTAGLTYTEARVLTPSFIGEMGRRHDEYEMQTNPVYAMLKGMSGKKTTGRRRR